VATRIVTNRRNYALRNAVVCRGVRVQKSDAGGRPTRTVQKVHPDNFPPGATIKICDHESEWFYEDDNYNMSATITFTHQCMFCKNLFSYGGLEWIYHMRRCLSQLEAPRLVLCAFFALANDFCTRVYDCTDDYHAQILPTRENCYRLVKTVVLR
jgi:hypothetical protein